MHTFTTYLHTQKNIRTVCDEEAIFYISRGDILEDSVLLWKYVVSNTQLSNFMELP